MLIERRKRRWLVAGFGLGLCALAALGVSLARPGSEKKVAFEHIVIDANGPQDLWLKSAGDINGDGRPDLVAGGHGGGGLVWYENPTWTKHSVPLEGSLSTDAEVADVDDDGDSDLVVLKAKELVWCENPNWAPHHIDDIVLHDIEVADLDGDGRLDIVGRNQGAFEGSTGDVLHIYRQESPTQWTHRAVKIPDGEGLLVADIESDGHPDAVVGGTWVENPGDILKGSWALHDYGGKWTYPHTFVAAGDFNGDGRTDLVLSPSERAGGSYHISWFEAPKDRSAGAWKEHIIEDPVETVHHFVGAADFNQDGEADIATAAMEQGQSPKITVFVNAGKGAHWITNVVAPVSSHSMRILDVDGDGLPDLYGGDWKGHRVDLWRNITGK